MTQTNLKPKPGARATRNGRPAWQAPLVRQRPALTNAEFFARQRKAREADLFEAFFGKLLAKVRR